LHWSFDDPADAQGSNADRLQVFRRVRDEIAERIRRWLNTTAPSSESDSKSLSEVKDRGDGDTVERMNEIRSFLRKVIDIANVRGQ
jgi:DNA-binding ferritin-like protein